MTMTAAEFIALVRRMREAQIDFKEASFLSFMDVVEKGNIVEALEKAVDEAEITDIANPGD